MAVGYWRVGIVVPACRRHDKILVESTSFLSRVLKYAKYMGAMERTPSLPFLTPSRHRVAAATKYTSRANSSGRKFSIFEPIASHQLLGSVPLPGSDWLSSFALGLVRLVAGQLWLILQDALTLNHLGKTALRQWYQRKPCKFNHVEYHDQFCRCFTTTTTPPPPRTLRNCSTITARAGAIGGHRRLVIAVEHLFVASSQFMLRDLIPLFPS